MEPQYYWKALHLPSDQYLVNHISGSILPTSVSGSKWYNKTELEYILKRKVNKFVKGPQIIGFEREDWELQQFKVTLHKTIRMKGPSMLSGKVLEKKIKTINHDKKKK